MIWKDEDELLECMLYWQKRALEAEKSLEVESKFVDLIFEWYEQTITEKEYWKQQFLDKDKEMKAVLGVDGDR